MARMKETLGLIKKNPKLPPPSVSEPEPAATGPSPLAGKVAQPNEPGDSKMSDTAKASVANAPKTEAPAITTRQKQALALEVVDLVTELRDTVKRIDPRRHTPKSLRRALANVSDIIADIQENLDQAKQEVKPA